MNNVMVGFYRSKYKPTVTPAASVPKDDEYHYMFSTQFESSDARRAFPCFDEPNLKATFDVQIEIPEDQVALSNMPEKNVSKGKDGRKVVAFEKTPVMSTYVGYQNLECSRHAQGRSLPSSIKLVFPDSSDCSYLPGPLETSNMSKNLRRESTMARRFRSESILPEASRSKGILASRTPIR